MTHALRVPLRHFKRVGVANARAAFWKGAAFGLAALVSYVVWFDGSIVKVHNRHMQPTNLNFAIAKRSAPATPTPPTLDPDPAPDLSADPLMPKQVRQARRFLGLTQAQFADELGVSLRTVKAWEHHDRNFADSRNCTGPARKLLIYLTKEKAK